LKKKNSLYNNSYLGTDRSGQYWQTTLKSETHEQRITNSL
jgi:hypothetical protein